MHDLTTAAGEEEALHFLDAYLERLSAILNSKASANWADLQFSGMVHTPEEQGARPAKLAEALDAVTPEYTRYVAHFKGPADTPPLPEPPSPKIRASSLVLMIPVDTAFLRQSTHYLRT